MRSRTEWGHDMNRSKMEWGYHEDGMSAKSLRGKERTDKEWEQVENRMRTGRGQDEDRKRTGRGPDEDRKRTECFSRWAPDLVEVPRSLSFLGQLYWILDTRHTKHTLDPASLHTTRSHYTNHSHIIKYKYRSKTPINFWF